MGHDQEKLPLFSIVEVKNYSKKELEKDNQTQTILLFKEQPKLVCTLKYIIAEPKDYTLRVKDDDFEKFKERFENLDISIPQ